MEIRSKSAEIFKSDNRLAALKCFLWLKPETAAWILWRMSVAKSVADKAEAIEEEEKWQETISRAHAMKAKSLQKLGLVEGDISFEELIPFRNELRYQYQQNHSDFMKLEAGEAFKALQDKAGVIEACTVYDHCILKLHGETEEVDRIVFLLESEKENNQFGGVRELDFKKDEATYLKPYFKEIADLFKALVEEKRQNEAEDKPLAGLADKLREAGKVLPEIQADVKPAIADTVSEDICEKADVVYNSNLCESRDVTTKGPVPEEPAHETDIQNAKENYFKRLTVHEVLDHKKLFVAFIEGDMNMLLEFGKLRYDLNEILANKQAISDLLSAARVLGE